MNQRNSYEFAYRFDSADAVLDAAPAMGSFHVQARVLGAGLGRSVATFSPIALAALDFACDPDHGIAFSTRSLKSIQAGLGGTAGRIGDVLEFEFEGFPGALSLHKFPTMEASAAILDAVRDLPGRILDEDRLADWRRSPPKAGPLCPCCQEKAERRCRDAARFPLTRILRHAAAEAIPLEFRVASDHVDVSSSFVPHTLATRGTYLVTTDAAACHASHLDLRLVHSLAISKVRREGRWVSTLTVWSVYGESLLCLQAADGGLASFWKAICEDPSSDGVSSLDAR